MASAMENREDDVDSVYENVDAFDNRIVEKRRRSSRGSSSADESSGPGSLTHFWADDVPPKTPTKTRNSSEVSSVKHSYDEVSINFGKPVILGREKIENEDDIFGSISFQSPIEDLTNDQKDLIFSFTGGPKPLPIPAPRPSKSRPSECKDSTEKTNGDAARDCDPIRDDADPRNSPSSCENQDDEDIYEDLDKVKAEVLENRNFQKPPEIPLRKSVSGLSVGVRPPREHAYENVYCEIPPVSIVDNKIENIMDRVEVIVKSSEALGARPRTTRSKSDTIDIRQTVSRWYEEAEKEVTRDLSLDLTQLESVGSGSRSEEDSKHLDDSFLGQLNQYEHVWVTEDGVRFALVNGKPVRIPKETTLLRDFDPIFSSGQKSLDIVDETDDESTPSLDSSLSSCSDVEGAQAMQSRDSRTKYSCLSEEIIEPLKKEIKKERKNRHVKENLYVALPHRRDSSSSTDLPPPDDPPPPPPSTSPPRLHKKVPGYENIWIAPSGRPTLHSPGLAYTQSFSSSTPPPTPPAVPPRKRKPTSDSSDQKSIKSSLSRKSETSSETGDRLSLRSSAAASDSLQYNQLPDDETLDELSKDNFRSSDSASDDDAQTSTVKSFSALNLTSKATKLASNLRRKMSDQVIVKSMMETGSAISSDLISLGRRYSGRRSSDGKMSTKNHSGVLFIYSKLKRAFQPKWCVLSSGEFQIFNDKASLALPKDKISLKHILSLRRLDSTSLSVTGDESDPLFCFDVIYFVAQKKFSIKSFGASSETDRKTWFEKLSQSLSLPTEILNMSDVSYFAWVHLKTGFASDWTKAWIRFLVGNRIMKYTSGNDDETESELDVKKIKNVTLAKSGKNFSAPDSSKPVIVIDATDRSLYIQVVHEKETTNLCQMIESMAFDSGNSLDDQQLTQEGVPVVVDKCIRFVYSHGCMTEGIYRHSGVNTKINQLLADFRHNAWAVHISRENYSEHDTANVLKRFMRTLDEPILVEELRPLWMEISSIEDQNERITRYRNLLQQLPDINYRTLKRLIGHLHAIADKCSKNLMPNYNLAAIWGPNLLTVDGSNNNKFALTSGEADVCRHFIDNYEVLFNVGPDELERERKITQVLEQINNHDRGRCPLKRSGDLRMWVYIDTRSSGNCICIEVHPNMTAREMTLAVLREAKKFEGQMEVDLNSNLVIHEVILGGSLERPLHSTEIMLEVTLKWGTWAEADRKDNYLLLKSNVFYDEALPCAVLPMMVIDNVFYADKKAKSSFKRLQISMKNACLTLAKDTKTSTNEIGSWPIEEICWYLGAEQKRRPLFNFNLTFIDRNKPVERSKDQPYFGRTISFESRDFFIKFIASMIVAEHPGVIATQNATLVELD